MNTGYVTRTNGKVPLRIVRGHNLESSMSMHRSAPVQSGVTIYSGMVISLVWANGRHEWIVGTEADYSTAAASPLLYFALTDSTKEDVVASDRLIGLPCSGNYILQTAYVTGTSFENDSFLTFDGVTGKVKALTGVETAGEPIIGQVVAGATETGLEDAVYRDISAGLGAQNVITFRTMFNLNLADAVV